MSEPTSTRMVGDDGRPWFACGECGVTIEHKGLCTRCNERQWNEDHEQDGYYTEDRQGYTDEFIEA